MKVELVKKGIFLKFRHKVQKCSFLEMWYLFQSTLYRENMMLSKGKVGNFGPKLAKSIFNY